MPDRGELIGGATVWDDLDFPILPRSTGSTVASYASIDSGGVLDYPQWQANDYHVCDGRELRHGWKQGSQISWHIHILTNGQEATEKYLKWEVIWAIAGVNAVLEERTTITTADIAIPANTPTKSHLLLPLGKVSLTNYKIGAHIFPRLKRVASSGAAPANNPWCWMLQAHLELDSLGSSEESSK